MIVAVALPPSRPARLVRFKTPASQAGDRGFKSHAGHLAIARRRALRDNHT